jgi:CheY-like chemotaxis protein
MMPPIKCLIIEDDSSLQSIYRVILQRMGFELTFITDGITALEQLQQVTPDLIFLDIRIPYIGGIDVYRYIKAEERLKDTRVVVVSALDSINQEFSDVEFYQKPINPTTIRKIAQTTHDIILSKV